MKEAITKFDLEAAFKALDEIEIPVAKKVRANRPALTEIFSRKTKLEALMEEYYDISDNSELTDAKEAREAEVAKAKLARIEKIVDLEADSPEDLLTSYVGKYIMQCPQCMTLFYKNPEDIIEAEDDPNTVNVNEVCQHCGNESGYTLVGKVGEATPEEADNFTSDLEMPEDLTDETFEEEGEVEESTNEDDDIEIDLDALNLEDEELPADEEDEEDKKEESFTTHDGALLVEELTDNSELDARLEAHSEYIEYLRDAIAQEEAKLEKANNEQVKVALQRNIDAFKADLEAALPDAVKNEMPSEMPADEESMEEVEDAKEPEAMEESIKYTKGKALKEATKSILAEGTGADSKAAAAAIAKELAKDDSNTKAKTASKIIEAIPDDFADQLFDTVKEKASDIKIESEHKKTLADATKGEVKEEDLADCDTLGKVLSFVDTFDWAEKNPKLLKGFVTAVLAIIAIIEPTPIVDIITIIVGLLPAEWVAKILAILNITSNPASLVGHAANKLYKAKKSSVAKDTKESMETSENTLTEDADLDISEAEFEELIKSPEFKKPISDTEARAILDAEQDDKEVEESVEDRPEEEDAQENLAEGVFDIFNSRAGKAEWILKNAMLDYEQAIINKKGDVETQKENQKFAAFVVICYKDTYKNSRKIESAPDPKNIANLEIGTKYPDVKTKYADAEKIAKGWSMKSDGGPAFIFLAKDANDPKAEFLCQYFNGNLDKDTDRLDTIIANIKKDLKGSKLRVKGGTDQSETRKLKVNTVKKGMQIKVDNDTIGEITKIDKGKSRLAQNQYVLTIKYADGKSEKETLNGDAELVILRDSLTTEGLNKFIAQLENLQESTLEPLISHSLSEAYGNVTSFKLTGCAYLDNKFTVDGTIYFASGNTRKTTYTFSEAFTKEGKVSMCGLNEKLGLDKQFILTGSIDSNKTFITESFTYKKK